MTRTRLAVMFLGVLGVGALPARAQTVPVGVARIDITPGFPVRLSGYRDRSAESAGVQQSLWAKALAIGSDTDSPVLLVSVDSLGVSDALTAEVARRLKSRAGIDRQRLSICASHTHSAPMLVGVAPNIFGTSVPDNEMARITTYTNELVARIEKVCLAALADRRPATLAWGKGTVKFAANRRTRLGPVDHTMPMLRVADPLGKPRAIVVGYACHCTTLNLKDNLISGDWAGDAQVEIEKDHPSAIAMVVIGCGADANPTDRLSRDAALRHGREIADEVNRLLATPLRPIRSTPVARATQVDLPFDTLPTRAQLEDLIRAGGPAGYNASTQMARLDRNEPLPTGIAYPLQSWTFGSDLVMLFLAGEVVVDYALRLNKEFDPTRLWIVSYANALPCYIPSERVLYEGGYEPVGSMVYYGWPTKFRPGLEDLIDKAAHEIIPAGFTRAVAPEVPAPATSPPPAPGRREDEGQAAAAAARMPPPLEPEAALQSIRTRPGLRVELVAAEPLVIDPVAIDWGADGKLWVCEMHDYPTGLDGHWKPGGRIRFLEDTNADGKYDKATTFLEPIPFPTWVMAWRKGALVCAAPDILYAEDTSGDGVADVKQVLYHGFATENYQARVNGLFYGLDNWVYGANGLIGGVIRGMASGKEVSLGGRDFRIDPDSGAMEPAAGLTQQGRTRDDWGNHFGGSNSVLLDHYPLAEQYTRRNDRVPAPRPAVFVPQDEDNSVLYPASRTLERYNHPERANRVTSACSPMIYRDNLLGDSFYGNAFVCEPVHNLVHREVLSAAGITFAGHRADDEKTSEFLASTDNWFRPVQVRTGPDGAIYVVDMYRFVIEHPRWISPEVLATLDVRAGDDRGRIYRVLPAEGQARAVPVLDRLSTPELAEALESPNGTLRDNVQRILVHRADLAAVPALERLARTSERPLVRMQALWTLAGLKALVDERILTALNDTHPGVRRQAIRLAEPRLGTNPRIGPALLPLVEDADLGVRYQLALSLGEWDDARAGKALGAIAIRDRGDAWVRAAVLSSATHEPGEILSAVLSASLSDSERSALVQPLIATLAGFGRPQDLAAAIDASAAVEAGQIPPWRLAALGELLDSTERPGRDPEMLRGLLHARRDRLAEALQAARRLVRDPGAKPADRAAVLRLLGRQPDQREADLDLLASLVQPQEPAEVQLAAVRALARSLDRHTPERLLAHWAAMGPALRSGVLDVLLQRPELADGLLTTIEQGRVPASEIDAAHRTRLLSIGGQALHQRAQKLLGEGRPRARQQVIEAYRQVLTRTGDANHGKQLFSKTCASCHKFGGQGHEVGPDLAALTDTSAEALLTAILDPNRDVDARYASYTAALADGRVLTGLMASETGNAITLKLQEGQTDVILRADLEELKTSGQSLMPEGLERDLSPADLADVIAYVAGGAERPKTFVGNQPRLVQPEADGTIRLAASTASIYGDTLVFEPELANLGYWHSANDRAVWTFVVKQPGTFTVTIEWACAEESAGNRYVIRVGEKAMPGVVGSTGQGTWANYHTIFLSELTLPAGTHRLELRPAGPIHGALMDLKAVVLSPRTEKVFRATAK